MLNCSYFVTFLTSKNCPLIENKEIMLISRASFVGTRLSLDELMRDQRENEVY